MRWSNGNSSEAHKSEVGGSNPPLVTIIRNLPNGFDRVGGSIST